MHRSRRTTKNRGDRKDLFWKNCLFQLGRELQLECLIRKTFFGVGRTAEGGTFDNSEFDNYLELVSQCKNRSFF